MRPTQPRALPAERPSNGKRPERTEGDQTVADAAVRAKSGGLPEQAAGDDATSQPATTGLTQSLPSSPDLAATMSGTPPAPGPATTLAAPPAGDEQPAAAPPPSATGGGSPEGSACTQAQLRRFIKSRPYVPMHELRRRFELNGEADDVNPMQLSGSTVYVGLPPRESGFLADLARQGEIGLELCHDPLVPIVVGVFAMRPVAR